MSRLPMYMQHEQAECGHACVAMISTYCGHDIDLQALRLRFPTTGSGLNLLQMRSLCWQLQLNAQALRIELGDLHQVTPPCILHWNLDHFVVLKWVSRQRICIHDPAIGVRICSFEELSQCFTGVILVVEPVPQFEKLRLSQPLRWKDLLQEAQGFKRAIVLMVSFSVFLELGQMLPVLLMQYVTDVVLSMQDLANLVTLLSGSLLLTLALVFLTYVRGRFMLHLSTQFKAQFCINGMRYLMRLPLAYFQKRLPGQIQLSFQAIEEVQKKLSTEIIDFLLTVILLILNGFMMLIYSGWLSVLVFISTSLGVGMRYVSYHTMKSHRQAAFNQQGKRMSHFLESIQNMLSLKSASKELLRWGQWRHLYVKALNIEFEISKLQLFYQACTQVLQQGEYIALVGLGAYFIHMQWLSLGMLIAFLAYRLTFVNKASELVIRLFEYNLMRVELERVQDVIAQPAEPIEPLALPVHQIQGALSVASVCFNYSETGRYLLEEVSFDVSPGEKLAIIGPSGCGKTTLLKLMMGLLVPTKGNIALDGMNLTDFGFSRYRQQISSVMQDDRLFSGSIIENIVFFEEKIDRPMLDEVCKLTLLEPWIATLPMGYGTRLGESGQLLSGGQKQRILLARALYKRPKILFLDEATSHLDVTLERQINGALKELSMTQIIIAHRKETIAMADRVFILRAGTI
jgi:ATP-binding cassette subfamily B protein RaxB